MSKTWFEMPDIRKRFYEKSVWIPLKESRVTLKDGERGNVGFTEEYYGVGSIIVPLDKKTDAEKLGWTEIGVRSSDAGFIENCEYLPAYLYKSYESDLIAEKLIIEAQGNSVECSEWLLNPDLIATLNLKREGDIWLAVSRGYEEVIKMERNENGCPSSVVIRALYLKDYLCARKMALYITSYRSRTQIMEDASSIGWSDDPVVEKEKMDRWEGRITEIHEGGHTFGSGFAMLHVSRTDVDFDEDIPELGFADDENTAMEKREGKFRGRKVYRVEGELWRDEWVNPADKSPIVCWDDVDPTCWFITDNSGKKESKKILVNGDSRWLWFKSSVVNEILSIRGSGLRWYTRDTGGITFSPSHSALHFGINQIGLINIYAKDIGLLPDWQQNIWVGHNVAPDGKVSRELLMSQMEAKPADTQAPEDFIQKGVDLINYLSVKKYDFPIFREHTEVKGIIRKAHRFRAVDRGGLFELAKDLYRITGERIDIEEIKKIVKPKEDEKWGSLKALEKLLSIEKAAYELMSPFWGIYTLRKSDAHLPSKELNDAFQICNVDQTKPSVFQGYQLIYACVATLYAIAKTLDSK